jgi:hypothetical protein
MIWDSGFLIEGQPLLSDSSPYQKETCLFLCLSRWEVSLLVRLGNMLYIDMYFQMFRSLEQRAVKASSKIASKAALRVL